MVASSHCSNMVFWVAPRRESIMALCSPSVMESAYTTQASLRCSDEKKQRESVTRKM